MLFSEPKIPQLNHDRQRDQRLNVSVLFSEPKIPQSFPPIRQICYRYAFQCSSASRKFLNRQRTRGGNGQQRSFSALQRAENSSIEGKHRRAYGLYAFQCSSASRKFLNSSQHYNVLARSISVSVLFSEPKIPQCDMLNNPAFTPAPVSVLFSEPKIPQSPDRGRVASVASRVSVLFSEPKIPQWLHKPPRRYEIVGFSALQRAENSSI